MYTVKNVNIISKREESKHLMVKRYTFSSKEELLKQAKKDKACSPGLIWAEGESSLEDIIREIPMFYAFWCIKRGYVQFEKNFPWEELTGDNWLWLLLDHPQFHVHCDWEKFVGFDWRVLLLKHPRFSNHCNWEMLNGADWQRLLQKHPQFAKYCDWRKLNGNNWSCLLSTHPQFSNHCDWETLCEDDWQYLLAKQPQFECFKVVNSND